MRYLISGATGFIGSHLAEYFSEKGEEVVALARPQSDTQFLESMRVAIHRGEFSDPIVQELVSQADVVIHCAAKVGDWGPVEDYRQVNVEGLRKFLDAAKGQGISRFIYMSSLGVYAARHHYGTDESEPLPEKHADGYTQSKVEAEKVALSYYKDFGVPVVVLRPGFVYGPRDKTVMPKIIDGLKKGLLRYPGGGHAALNTIYVGNLVRAVELAVGAEQAVGQIYNLTDGEYVSKQQFIEAVADAMELPRPTRKPPLWFAKMVTTISEGMAKLTKAQEAPLFTTAKLKFLGYNLDFSIDKAKLELGYNPRTSFEDGIFFTMKWYREHYGSQEPVSKS